MRAATFSCCKTCSREGCSDHWCHGGQTGCPVCRLCDDHADEAGTCDECVELRAS